ncbi:MAG: DUF1579 family protein, partial [Candidatus Omnitrophica bacterium]|nr:DUF1579 family protein [Candidatus Omnitrophota bacterium]
MKLKLATAFILGVGLTTGALAVHAGVTAKEAPASEQEQAMHQKMMAYSTTNEHHAFLKTLEGRWTAQVSFWMDPSGAPEVSQGTSDAKVIMNGRFLEQTFNGTTMGQPFEGRSILGYDNLKKEYVNVWFDNMATGMVTSQGQYDSSA